MNGDNLTVSVTILLTGFAVVFAVLLVLIGIIKLYGTIIYNLQNKKKTKKTKVAVERVEAPSAPEPRPAAVVESAVQNDDDLIAVISAAVYTVYSPDQVRIRSIRRAPSGASAWRAAGLRDSTRTF